MSKPTKPKLTAKQRRFCNEYLIDLNATQAAIRAGYSKKTAEQGGAQLLRNIKVLTEINGRMKDRQARTEITQDRVLKELAKIGFSDIRKAVAWGPEVPVSDPITGETLAANGVALLASKELDDATAGAVAEISQTAQGIKIKLHDKRAALVDLGRHLGMFPTKVEHSGPDGSPFTITLLAADKDA